ncbi:MAG: radical SAM/SPASM domain-containing protein [Bacteroidota bacterium]
MRRKTFFRVVNFIKLLSSFFLSILLRKPIHWGFPAFVSIEPTNHCNLRCPECPTGQRGLTRASGNLKQQDFEHIIDQISPGIAYLTLYFQGEPYLNKDLFGFISYARTRNIYVWTSTNGHYLSDENIRRTIDSGLNKLIISVDGTDQKAYEQYRIGGSLETVTEGIRNFVWIRKEMGARKPTLQIQFLVLKSNQHQIEEIKKLGNSLGVDRTVLKTAQFYDYEQGSALMPEDGKWTRYRKQGTEAQRHRGTDKPSPVTSLKSAVLSPQSAVTNHHFTISPSHHFTIKNPLPNRCFRMWSGCVITWDGKVVPCCFDKDAGHCMGDLKEQSFEEIWRGEKYRKFRGTILRNRKSVDICRNCSQKF